MAISLSQHSTPAHIPFTDSPSIGVQSEPSVKDRHGTPTEHYFPKKSVSCDADFQAVKHDKPTCSEQKISDLFKECEFEGWDILEDHKSPWYRQSEPVPRKFSSSPLQSRIDPSESFVQEIFRGESDNQE